MGSTSRRCLNVPTIAEERSIPPSQFGLALASALISMLFSAALLAPLGDRLGRRPMIVTALALAGVPSLATAQATSITTLSLARALTGVGLGMSMPNAVARASEFVPVRRKALSVTIVYSSVALGSLVSGFIGPFVIHGL